MQEKRPCLVSNITYFIVISFETPTLITSYYFDNLPSLLITTVMLKSFEPSGF